MEESYGIEELKKILFFIVEGGNVAEKIEKEKNWIAKAASILPLTDEFIGLITLSPKKVPLELKDLSASEKKELIDLATAKYNLDDKTKEALIEEGLIVAAQLVETLREMVTYAKKWKKS